MEAKEKAKELIDKFKPFVDSEKAGDNGFVYDRNTMMVNAKQCALIAVDEMIIQNGELYLIGFCEDYYREKNSYLFDLKSEINKL